MAQYGTAVDRDSASERLAARAAEATAEAAASEAPATGQSVREGGTVVSGVDLGDLEEMRRDEEAAARRAQKEAEKPSDFEKAMGNFVKSAGTQLGREVVRSVLGTRSRRGGGLLGGLFGR